MKLLLLPDRLAVCQLPPDAPAPSLRSFSSVTRTADELSIICAQEDAPEGGLVECGWRAFRVEGTLEFSLTGVLASIAQPLAAAGISIFAFSTYNTDYVMVKEHDLDRATKALEGAGHRVQ